MQTLEIIEPKLFAGAVADEIVTSLNEAVSERGRVSVALAGGNTPGEIYRSLSRPPRVDDVEWQKVTFYWGDERWVAHTDVQSNYKMVAETLLSNLPSPGPVIHALDTSLKTPELGAKTYAQTIRQAEKATGNQVPILDLVLLGLGEDGHTASIFPGTDLLKPGSNADLMAAVKKPEDSSWRVTMTPEFLLAARRILFLVKGAGKAEVVQKIIEGDAPSIELPARIWSKAKDKVTWFLDSEAAAKLTR